MPVLLRFLLGGFLIVCGVVLGAFIGLVTHRPLVNTLSGYPRPESCFIDHIDCFDTREGRVTVGDDRNTAVQRLASTAWYYQACPNLMTKYIRSLPYQATHDVFVYGSNFSKHAYVLILRSGDIDGRWTVQEVLSLSQEDNRIFSDCPPQSIWNENPMSPESTLILVGLFMMVTSSWWPALPKRLLYSVRPSTEAIAQSLLLFVGGFLFGAGLALWDILLLLMLALPLFRIIDLFR